MVTPRKHRHNPKANDEREKQYKNEPIQNALGVALGFALLVTAVIPFTGFAHSGGIDMDWTVIA